MPRRLPVLLLACFATLACTESRTPVAPDAADAESQLLLLQDERYTAGILTRVGGRLVLFRRSDGDNAILADPAQWSQPGPEVGPETGWTTYNGHIAWLGPQAEWWTRQDLNPKRQERAANWPPDPYLIYAAYELVESSPTLAVLRGPHSPLTGVTLTKRYELTAAGLELTVTATNTGEEPVSWDLWSNTRFDGDTTRCFVPLPAKGAALRGDLAYGNPIERGPVFYDVVDGCFSLRLGPGATPGTARANVKYFMNPGAPWLAAFPPSGDCFIKRITVAEGEPAPDHGRVEIYTHRSADGDDGLLEIEHHDAYTTLQPGEAMSQHETWELHAYDGADEPAAQVAFVRERL